jgi:hypothetical protein
MIHSLLGEDAKVLKSDETQELQTFLQKQLTDNNKDESIEGWETKHRNILDKFRNTPEFILAKEIPDKTRIGRVKVGANQNLVFIRKNQNMYFQSLVNDRLLTTTTQEALDLIQADIQDIDSYPVSKEFRQSYFASIPTFYSSESKSKTATKFSRPLEVTKKEANSNWSKADNFITKLIKDTPNLDSEDRAYLTQLQQLIGDYKALSQRDVKEIIKLNEVKKGVDSIKELLPPKHIENVFGLCQDIDNEPKTVVLIQEIKPNISDFDSVINPRLPNKLTQ